MLVRPGAHVLWAVLAILLAAAVPARAQNAGAALTPPVVIVVDTNRIQRDSLAGKMIVTQREKYQQSFQAEFEASRKQLQQAETDLAKQKASMSAQAFEAQARAFNEEVASFQRRYQSAIRALDKSTAAAQAELQRVTIETTSEVGAEMGAGLVLHKQNVFLHDERMEVTEKVIERINKRLPSVNFPPPVLDGQPPAKPAAPKPSKK